VAKPLPGGDVSKEADVESMIKTVRYSSTTLKGSARVMLAFAQHFLISYYTLSFFQAVDAWGTVDILTNNARFGDHCLYLS